MSPITRVCDYPIIPVPDRSMIYPHKFRPVICVGIKRFAAIMLSREFVPNASNIRPTVISPPSAGRARPGDQAGEFDREWE